MRRILIAGPLLALLAISCGAPATVHVFGDVTFDGEPVAEGEIAFEPTGDSRGPQTGGMIRDGKYDMPAAVGPLVGLTYKVRITAGRPSGKTVPNPGSSDAQPIPVLEAFIPDRYNRESELIVTITRTTNRLDFPLTSTGK